MPNKPAIPAIFRLLSDEERNTIRGKASVGRASLAEIQSVFRHIDTLEMKLDDVDVISALETFGPGGWRKAFGYPDAE